MSDRHLYGMVFLPFAFGHFLQCLLRNVNATLAPQLMAALALTPGQLGLLTSVYFFSFALVQLPVGMALDRWGPARVQWPMLLLAVLAALGFAGGQQFSQLLAARAAGLRAGWLFHGGAESLFAVGEPARLPSLQGYLVAVGGLGAASATLPVRWLLHYAGWRGVFIGLALLVLAGALLLRWRAPRAAIDEGAPASSAALRLVLQDASFRQVLRLLLVPHMVYFGVQGLWLGRWLSDAGHYPEVQVGYLLYLSMAAIIFGAIVMGRLTQWAARRGIAMLHIAACGVALFLLVQLAMLCRWPPAFPVLAVLFTLTGTATGMDYTILAQNMPASLSARAVTLLNLLIFMGAFAVQAGFGLVVALWPSAGQQSPVQAYQAAYGLLIMLQLPGLLRYLWPQLSGRMGPRPATSLSTPR
ncbi:MFS transporter [Pseudoduganella danionis]|uniref:MFS transporter n=1 Tax=Pseudoduganella danionis TaxID=1890295 RepID=UPI00360CCC69